MKGLIFLSATKLAKAIRDKEVSSEEAVNAYLERIAEVNPKLSRRSTDGGQSTPGGD